MKEFDRVPSGIPEMDDSLHGIRLGDNVVFRVSNLDEFHYFLDPFVLQSLNDGRHVVYVRFANHEPLLKPTGGLTVIPVRLSHKFEKFTVEIHELIEREPDETIFIFDCLSELQTAWATDLMMTNFFMVTCPYLFERRTVTYFPLIRGKHSFKAVAQIRDTTQVFLDVYSLLREVYVRPVKVWNRYSETMFLPHRYRPEAETFRPVLDGVQMSRFYQAMNEAGQAQTKNMDSWDRFFEEALQKYETGLDVTEECSRMCDIMMTRDARIKEMVIRNFRPTDYFSVHERMIGTGLIGGKACGMLLSRSIIENKRPDLFAKFEPHDSYYVGSDVFYSYIVNNHFWDLRVKQRQNEGYFTLADQLAEKFRTGTFSRDLEEQFVKMLEYYGQDPIIVRSSSILEDGFGNAFAGKYESVFCSNSGSLDERLREFEDAVRCVYASTMSLSALDYRKRRGLDTRDEQMGLLIMRVSGSRYGDDYMPCAAGVGYSVSPYRFLPSLDPKAGMLRLVMGLGTAAVDRREGSYPRLVSLDKPEETAAATPSERHQYSQRKVEMINMTHHRVEQVNFEDVMPRVPAYLRDAVLEHDYDAERAFRERGHVRNVMFLSCRGLTRRKDLMADMRGILAAVQEEYQYPVDTEFTINLSEDGDYVINLLQCRPLQVFHEDGTATGDIPSHIDRDTILLETEGASMGLSRQDDIDSIVYVDPIGYYSMPYREKTLVARAVSRINWYFRGRGRNIMLMVPGRVGTSSPELGVPTTFADISEFNEVCEMAESRVGYRPEMSYGSHFFQDLVEADILYTAVFENKKTVIFRPGRLKAYTNRLHDIAPEFSDLEAIIGVYDVRGHVYHNMGTERTVFTLDPLSAEEDDGKTAN